MKKTTLDKININNTLDIMYEPEKQRYSVLEYDGSRKEIEKKTFTELLKEGK